MNETMDVFPTTREAARKANKTYFLASRECPIHNTRMHWVSTGGCMAGGAIDGNPFMVRPQYRRIPRSGEFA